MREIEELVIENAGQSFVGDDFRMLCKPCVYMFMEKGIPIYIGMSGNGLTRPLQRGHRQWYRARKECDELRIYPCKSIEAARQLERILLCRTQPRYNVNGKRIYANQLLGNSMRNSALH